MNYILGILIASIVVLFLYSKHLYDKNNILIENEKVIISGYETSIKNIEDKAKSIILEKYPLEKQSSAQLGIYGEVYLSEMKTFISNIIRISNEAEANGIKLEDILWQ